MLDEKKLQEIREFENAGLDVVVIGNNEEIDYSTQSNNGNCEYCDQCNSFRLLPDPDPFDDFRDGDMKAICLEINGVIAGSLERPSEWTNMEKPLYCPKLGRELNEKEKEIAKRRLAIATGNMK